MGDTDGGRSPETKGEGEGGEGGEGEIEVVGEGEHVQQGMDQR